MILKTADFKEVCSSILSATDSNELAEITETLELVTEGRTLYLNVTNKEYYVSQKFELDHEEEFHATVNATLFLKLIANITTEDIELVLADTYLLVKANGNYKIPFMATSDGQLLTLPTIDIVNKTVEMNIPYDTLASIADFNSKELATSSLARAVQKLFYVDQQGCITFTTGACVNSFILEKPVKILLNSRIVKLFKLFKSSPMVKFELGYDAISDTITQTKVAFANDKIKLSAIIGCDDSLLDQVPAAKIRERADKAYPNKIVLNTQEVAEAISRLLLFNDAKNAKPYATFKFDVTGKLTIFDTKGENSETLNYQSGSELSGEYVMRIDFLDFKKVLDGYSDPLITLSFGDNKACVVTRKAIKNVIPECRSSN